MKEATPEKIWEIFPKKEQSQRNLIPRKEHVWQVRGARTVERERHEPGKCDGGEMVRPRGNQDPDNSYLRGHSKTSGIYLYVTYH